MATDNLLARDLRNIELPWLSTRWFRWVMLGALAATVMRAVTERRTTRGHPALI